MKIIGIDDEEKPRKLTRKLNSRKLATLIIIAVIALIVLILFAVYSFNEPFRGLVDKYILMKSIVEDSTAYITLENNESDTVFAYDKYICVLSKNMLTNYNSYGKEEGKISVEITTPTMTTNGKYLLLAEKDSSKVYLISGNNIIWEKDLEGNIDKMTVNKNGYVAVVLSGTTYKSVIQTFDNSGDELFKTYLSSTVAMDIDISQDNQYLALLEVNTNGTMVQSIVKTISIQKAKQKTKDTSIDPITYTYADEEGNLIVNIKYQEGNRLLCLYDNSIHMIKSDENIEIMALTENGTKISFADIELSNNVYRIVEKSSLISTGTSIEILSPSSGNINYYNFDGVVKESYSYDDTIAVNIGSEVHFISTNGWLIKKYLSNQEIKKVVLCNSFAGIVYRNKVEIVNI